jgi:hypothetical protein
MARDLFFDIPLAEIELDTLSRILRLHTDTANKSTRAVLRRVLEKLDHAVPRVGEAE